MTSVVFQRIIIACSLKCVKFLLITTVTEKLSIRTKIRLEYRAYIFNCVTYCYI